MFPEILKSHWIGPFVVTNIFPHSAVEIQNLDSGKVFKVNRHRLKLFYEGCEVQIIKDILLDSPSLEI